MSDEPFTRPIPLPPADEAVYDAICATVMETVRGRWFMAEFASRNRNADTRLLLAAIDRINATIQGEPAAPSGEHLRMVLTEMAAAIARTRARNESASSQDLPGALERATHALRAATEKMHDVGWQLREHQYDDRFCDQIDLGTNEISSACVALDATVAHARDLVALIGALEGHIGSAIGPDHDVNRAAAPADVHIAAGSLSVSESPPAVAFVVTAEAADRSAGKPAFSQPPEADGWLSSLLAARTAAATPAAQIESATAEISDDFGEAAQAIAQADVESFARPAVEPGPAPATHGIPPGAQDPLAPIRALTDEEKIALFS